MQILSARLLMSRLERHTPAGKSPVAAPYMFLSSMTRSPRFAWPRFRRVPSLSADLLTRRLDRHTPGRRLESPVLQEVRPASTGEIVDHI